MKKGLWAICSVFFCGLIGASEAQARVFDFKTHRLAAYFRGTAGQQNSEQLGYAYSSGDGTSFNRDVEYNFGGEFGFVWNFSESTAVRIGGEFVQTKNAELTGRDSSYNKLLDLTTSAKAFNPNLTLEWALAQSDSFRYIIYGGVGWAQMTITNEYTNNTTGTGDTSYKEVVKGDSFSYHGGLGMEFLMFDNVTMSWDVGYRQMRVTRFTHSDTVNTVNGPKIKGARAKFNDDTNREMSLNGVYVGLTFRFYIPPIKF